MLKKYLQNLILIIFVTLKSDLNIRVRRPCSSDGFRGSSLPVYGNRPAPVLLDTVVCVPVGKNGERPLKDPRKVDR